MCAELFAISIALLHIVGAGSNSMCVMSAITETLAIDF